MLLDIAFYIYRYNIRTAHAVYGEGIGRACNELIVIVAAAVFSVVCNPDHLLLLGIGHAEVIHTRRNLNGGGARNQYRGGGGAAVKSGRKHVVKGGHADVT